MNRYISFASSSSAERKIREGLERDVLNRFKEKMLDGDAMQKLQSKYDLALANELSEKKEYDNLGNSQEWKGFIHQLIDCARKWNVYIWKVGELENLFVETSPAEERKSADRKKAAEMRKAMKTVLEEMDKSKGRDPPVITVQWLHSNWRIIPFKVVVEMVKVLLDNDDENLKDFIEFLHKI